MRFSTSHSSSKMISGAIALVLAASTFTLAAPTLSQYITPTLSTLPDSNIIIANASDVTTAIDKRQLDPVQLKRVAFLAQRLNANPQPITDYSTPCNEAICSCATGAAENCFGGSFSTQSCDGTGCLIMPRFDNAQGVVAQCISVADATNIFNAIGAPGGPTGVF